MSALIAWRCAYATLDTRVVAGRRVAAYKRWLDLWLA